MSVSENDRGLIIPGSYLKTNAELSEEYQRRADLAIRARTNRQKMIEVMRDAGQPYYEAFSAAGYIINTRGLARHQFPRMWHGTASWTYADTRGNYRISLDFHPQRPFLKPDSIIPDKARIDFDSCLGFRQEFVYDQNGENTGKTVNVDRPRAARLEVGFANHSVSRLRFIGQDMYPQHLAVYQPGTALQGFAERFCYAAEKRRTNWWWELTGRWRFEAWLDGAPTFKLGQGDTGQSGFYTTRFCYDPADNQAHRKKDRWGWGDLSYFKRDGVSQETSIGEDEMVAVVRSVLSLIPLTRISLLV